jgi:hypothetical protein
MKEPKLKEGGDCPSCNEPLLRMHYASGHQRSVRKFLRCSTCHEVFEIGKDDAVDDKKLEMIYRGCAGISAVIIIIIALGIIQWILTLE